MCLKNDSFFPFFLANFFSWSTSFFPTSFSPWPCILRLDAYFREMSTAELFLLYLPLLLSQTPRTPPPPPFGLHFFAPPFSIQNQFVKFWFFLWNLSIMPLCEMFTKLFWKISYAFGRVNWSKGRPIIANWGIWEVNIDGILNVGKENAVLSLSYRYHLAVFFWKLGQFVLS